jgi:predicted DNA-binding transcriptional regulator AlpA
MKDTAAKSNDRSRLYTLTEVARAVGISMPTVQRYKSLYQERIPSVGEGRKQRYPKEALAVFEQLKEENRGRRGRPRKDPSAAPTRRAARSKAAASDDQLLTLTEVGKQTGISYPTLIRYVQSHGKEIPHQGRGRRRRFQPEAVEIFKRLRSESRPGRKPKASGAASSPARGRAAASDGRVDRLEKSVAKLQKQLSQLVNKLRKPRRVI